MALTPLMMVSTEKKNSYSLDEKEKIATITDWHSINWKRAERQVGILQKKITNAHSYPIDKGVQ
jgi:hypothetical protein